MKKLSTLAVLLTFISTAALADCRDQYSLAVHAARVDAKASRAVTGSAVATTALTAGILASAGTFGIGGIAIAGSGAIVAGAQLYKRERKVHELRDTLALIKEAYAQNGPHLAKFMKKLSKHHQAGLEQVAPAIVELNEADQFCPVDEYGDAHLASAKQIYKAINAALK